MPVYTHNYSIEPRDFARFISGSNQIGISKSTRNKVVTFNDNIIPSLKPIITYNTYIISDVDAQVVMLEDGPIFHSPKLAKTMCSSREIVCFLATVGPQLDEEVSRLSAKGRISSAYILDAMGSGLVESVVDNFQDKMSKKMRPQGMGVTVRFSPGYCDWPLTQQRELFSLLDAQELGVKLSRSCLMTPRKSISGVFGIHPLDQQLQPYIPCQECGRKNCAARRAQPGGSVQSPDRAETT